METLAKKQTTTIDFLMDESIKNLGIESFITKFGISTHHRLDEREKTEVLFVRNIKNLLIKDYAQSMDLDPKNWKPISQIVQEFFERNPLIFDWIWNYNYDVIGDRYRLLGWVLRGHYINALVRQTHSLWLDDKNELINELNKYTEEFFRKLLPPEKIEELRLRNDQVSSIICRSFEELKHYPYEVIHNKFMDINKTDIAAINKDASHVKIADFAVIKTVKDRSISSFIKFMKW